MKKYILFIVELVVIAIMMIIPGALLSIIFPEYTMACIAFCMIFGVGFFALFALYSFDKAQELIEVVIKNGPLGEIILAFILSSLN